MDQVPAISDPVIPTNVVRIFPQQFSLVCCAAGVPQAVPQELSRSSIAVNKFDLDSCFCVGQERFLAPVIFSLSFPGNGIEPAVTLETEHKANEVVVDPDVNIECAFEVNVCKAIVAHS